MSTQLHWNHISYFIFSSCYNKKMSDFQLNTTLLVGVFLAKTWRNLPNAMQNLSETEGKFDVMFLTFLLKSISFTICFHWFNKCGKNTFFHFFVFCDLKKCQFFLTKWWFFNIWSFRRRGKGGYFAQFFEVLLQFKKQK